MSSIRTGENKAAPWSQALRNPWTVACTVALVVLGPAASTASALDRANQAPMYHAVHAAHTAEHGTAPKDGRGRHAAPARETVYATLPESIRRTQVLKRSQSFG
ncbi:hypothetical protein OK074_4846 [Actinobacteria bacterium OK074]|nr:hypothetical protein OK074_4846 [Actinobacteria bacterium OK074]